MRYRVSVILPAWNMARFLFDAVASIPEVHEIIIVAAESDDDTVESRARACRRTAGSSRAGRFEKGTSNREKYRAA